MFYVNQVFEQASTGNRIRILDSGEKSDAVWCCNISDTKALPFAIESNDLKAAITAGELRELKTTTTATTLKPSSTRAQARRDFAYECIAPLLATADIFVPALRSTLVKARANEYGCSEQTIYRYLRLWWCGGQNKNALLPNFKNSGNSGGGTANRGRPPKHSDAPIYQLTERDHALFEKVLKGIFLKEEKMTLDATYQRLMEMHYAHTDAEGRRQINPPGEFPTLTQFRYYVRKNLPKEAVIRAKKGDAHFELNHRAKLGSLQAQTYTVGETYEIDATIADTFLVHADDRSKIIGKPTLYMTRDRKSNLVTGFYVGLESPSWPAAMHAIKSICEDKAVLCARYNVPYDPNDWPADGVLPKTLVCDRGAEMLYNSSTQLADNLNVIVLNNPARRGDWKPHVECGFKQIQHSLADSMPGYTPPENFGKRQVKDYSQDSALTLHEFSRLILLEIIRSNRAAMEGYVLPNMYVLNEMQATPINIWNAEIVGRAGLLRKYSEEEVRFALLPQQKGYVSRDGIRIGSCYYSAPEAIAKGWFVAAGRSAFTVNVSFDRRLVDEIYIHDDKDPGNFFVAQLLDKCSHLRGKSFSEVEALEDIRKRITTEGAYLNRQLKSDLHAATDSMIKNAVVAAKEASKGKSRSARKKDTVAARDDARKQERQESARLTTKPDTNAKAARVIPMPSTTPGSANAEPAKPKSLMQQKYQEMLDGL